MDKYNITEFRCINESELKYCTGIIKYNNVTKLQRCNTCNNIYTDKEVKNFIEKNNYKQFLNETSKTKIS